LVGLGLNGLDILAIDVKDKQWSSFDMDLTLNIIISRRKPLLINVSRCYTSDLHLGDSFPYRVSRAHAAPRWS
jgi:hypothetical protein